jgi:hypothetical protein
MTPRAPDPEWVRGLKEGDSAGVARNGELLFVVVVRSVDQHRIRVLPNDIFRTNGYEVHPTMGGSRYLVPVESKP